MSTILLPYPAAYGTSPLECGEIAARNVTLEMDCFQNHHLKRWKIWVNLFNYDRNRAAFWRALHAWGRKVPHHSGSVRRAGVACLREDYQ